MNEPFNKADNNPVFNSGIAYLMRIDTLLRKATEFSLTNNLWLWGASLKALFRDVFYYLTDEERDEFERMFNDLESVRPVSHFETKKEELDHFGSYEKLHELDILLRYKIHSNGLLMPHKDNPAMAIL